MIQLLFTERIGELCILHGEVGCCNGVLSCSIQQHAFIPCQTQPFMAEVCDLSCNLCRQTAGIETSDASDTRAPRDTSIPEVLFSYAIWSHYPKSSDNYSSAHKLLLSQCLSCRLATVKQGQ